VVLILGAAMPLMTILIGNLTNLLGSIVSPGAPGIQSLSSVQEFHTKVAHQALVLVCLGIAVFVATYIGTVCWIITGERISRRIRMYVFSFGLS
jgi:ATP-binding cassette subfamily B (MDR/TAP) protein 1